MGEAVKLAWFSLGIYAISPVDRYAPQSKYTFFFSKVQSLNFLSYSPMLFISRTACVVCFTESVMMARRTAAAGPYHAPHGSCFTAKEHEEVSFLSQSWNNTN
ncbi:MAG: hypothetical protein KDE19_01305 [Caldilineaceae bacterium]|nr:hypothetical protein [Caldilineaceae bacterium]